VRNELQNVGYWTDEGPRLATTLALPALVLEGERVGSVSSATLKLPFWSVSNWT
jgi:hypothetical protein